MGLLEKAQQLKESSDVKKKITIKIEDKKEKKEQEIEISNKKEKIKITESEGLLNKVKEKKRLQSEKKDIKKVNEPRDVIIIDNKLEESKSDGLLNRVHEKRRIQSEKKDLIPAYEPREIIPFEDRIVESKPDGLLDKVQEKRKEISEKKKYIRFDSKGKKEIIEEKTGFGWKGLGTRRIVFDHNINEYVYELHEPVLNETEIQIKDELSRLFKMLADVNITNLEKDEKEKYLEETLEQIIIDNNIKFTRKKTEEKDRKKQNPFKKLFSFKKKDEKEKNLDKTASSEKKEEKKGKLSKKLISFKRKDKHEKPKKRITNRK